MSIEDLLTRGATLYGHGNLTEAVDCYQRVLALDTNNLTAMVYLGALLQRLGRREDAIDVFRRATRVAPDNHSFQLLLGTALGEARRFDEAIAALTRSIELHDADYKAWQELGKALMANGKRPEAVDCFQNAVSLLERSGDREKVRAGYLAAWDKDHAGKQFSPKHIAIETMAACNGECVYCPVSNNPRRSGKMSDEMLDSIFDQLETLEYCGQVEFHFYNEPLLDKRLPKIIERAKASLPRAKLLIVTNGTVLDIEKARILIDAGIDMIRVSIHAPETLDKVAAILNELPVDQRDHLRYTKFYDGTAEFTDRANTINVDPNKYTIRNYPSLFTCMVVGWLNIDYRGTVHLCCNDFHAEHILGLVGEESLLSIWQRNAPLLREIAAGNYTLPICRRCAALE